MKNSNIGRTNYLRCVLESRLLYDGSVAAVALTALPIKTEADAQTSTDSSHGVAAADQAVIDSHPTSDATPVRNVLDTIKQISAPTALITDKDNNAQALFESLKVTTTEPSPFHLDKEIIFIDSNIADYQDILKSIGPYYDVYKIDMQRSDAIAQISNILKTQTNVDAIHIISHGKSGGIEIADNPLDATSLTTTYAADMAIWRASLSAEGDVLLYGCDIGEGESGQLFTQTLSSVLGADVAASTTLTGHQRLGGDWVLERQVGIIDAQALNAGDWYGSLAYSNVSAPWTVDVVNQSATTTIDGVKVTVTFVNSATSVWTNEGNETLNNINAFSNNAQNTPSITADWASSQTGQIVIKFDKEVTNPLIHIDRLGGVTNGTSTSNLLTLVTPGASLQKDSGPSHFRVNTTNNTITRTVNQTVAFNAESSLDPAGGTAAGTVKVLGTFGGSNGANSIVFNVTINPNGTYNIGDSIELSVSLDAPAVAVNDTVSTFENSNVSGNVTNNDLYGPFVVTPQNSLGSNGGTFNITSNGDYSFNPGTSFDYLAAGQTVTTSVNYVVRDTVNTTSFSTGTLTVTVIGENDAPVNSLPAGYTTNEDTSIKLTNLSVSDVDAGLSTITVTLSVPVASGALTATTGSGVTVSGSGTNAIVLSGTLVNINNYLASTAAPNYVPVLNANGVVNLTMVSSDGSLSDTDTRVITINAVNDAPVNTLPAAYSTNEDVSLQLTGLSVSDVDAGAGALTITLSVPASSGTLTAIAGAGVTVSGSGTNVLVLSGSLANLNSYLASTAAPTYVPVANANGAVTLTMTTNDNGNTGAGGSLSDTDTRVITINAVNDAPVNTLPAAYSTNEDVSLQLTGLSVSDVDAGAGTLTITLSVPASSGTLTATAGSGVTVSGSGTNALVLSGSLANLNSYLASTAAPTYVPVANANGAVTLTMTTNDNGNTGAGGSLSDTDTRVITINAVNDAPVNTLPAAYSTNEDVSLQLTGLSVSDVDAGAGTLTITLSIPASSGTLTAIAGAGVTVSGSGTNALVLSGSLANLNSYLASTAAPTYVPVANANGTVTLTMTTDDNGNTGAGGSLSDTDTRVITINAVNDAPVNTLPAAYSTNEDVSLQLTGLSVSDVDAGAGALTITLSVPASSGTLTAIAGAGVTVSGSGTNALVLSGSLANLNSYLASTAAPTYVPVANANGTVTLTMTTNDNGNTGAGGSLSDTDTRVITINAVNDAPVNTLPAAYSTNEDVSLQLTGLSVSDVDAGAGALTITLSVPASSGTLTAIAGAGVTVSGSGTNALVLSGSLANLNSYLASTAAPTYVPVVNANGTVTLTMTTNDNGNTGAGGSLSDTDTRVITINAVNDAPVNTLPAAYSTNEDVSLQLTGLSVSDVDAGAGALTITLSVPASSGTLTAIAGAGVTVSGSGTNALVLSGSLANLNSYLASTAAPTYVPVANANGTVTLTMTTNDNGNTGAGGSLSDTDTRVITINAVNDAPVNTLPAAYSTNEDVSLQLTGLSVSDVDAGAGALTITLSIPASSGTLTAIAGAGVTVSGSGTNALVLSGSLANLNSYLASTVAPTYVPVANANGTVTLTMTTNDNGNTGAGGSLSDTDTRVITINAVNDAPVNTLPAAYSTNEDVSLQLTGLSVSDVDAGAGALTITLSVPASSGTLTAIAGAGVTVSGSGTNALVLSGSLANLNSYLASTAAPTYVPVANANGAVTLTMTTNDNGNTGAGGSLSDTDTRVITINAVNDAPVNTLPAAYSTNEDVSLQLTGLSVSDIDAGAGTLTITLSIPASSGTLTAIAGAGVTVSGSGTNALVLSGSLANLNSYLASTAAPTYVPVANANGTVTLTMTTNDNGNTGAGGSLSDTDTRVITINAVNDAPVAVDDNISGAEDTTITLLPLANDQDVDGDPLVVTQIAGTTIVAGSAQSITIIGGVVNVSATGAISFTPTANFNGTTGFSYTISDGQGGSSSANYSITVTPVNDAPVNTLPAGYSTNEDVSLQLTGLSVSDVDAGAGAVSVTLEVASGSLTAVNAGGVTVSGSGSSILNLSGSVADINSYLSSLNAPTYVPVANANGAVTLTMTTNDNGNTGAGGSLSDTDTRVITINAVNDAPVNTLPAAYSTNEDVSLQLTGLSVSDVDAGAGALTITLSIPASSGTLTAIAGAGVTVSGSGTNALVLSGSLANLNSYLASTAAPTYVPVANANGTVTLTMTTNDNGNTGAGGSLSDTDTRVITINAVNDAPVAVDDNISGAEDTTITLLPLANDQDVDGDPLVVTQIAGTTIVAGSAQSITIIGGVVNVSATGAISFTPTANFNGTTGFSYTISDGQGGSSSANYSITVTPVNDAPVNTLPAAYSTNEDVSLQLTGLSVSDIDAGAGAVSVTLEVASGSLTAVNAGGVTVSGSGSSILNLSGSVADINSYLSSLNAPTYVPVANANGAVTLTMTTNDNGNTGAGGSLSDTDTRVITINAINDAPTQVLPGMQTTLEDSSFNLTGITVEDADGDILTTTISSAHGTLSVSPIFGGTIINNGTASLQLIGTATQINNALTSLIYTPGGDFNGLDNVTIVTSDGNLSQSGVIGVTVIPVADIVPDIITLPEDTITTFNPILGTNGTNADTFNAGAYISAINNTPVIIGQEIRIDHGVLVIGTDNNITFKPDANFNGVATYSYTITSNGTRETATQAIQITPVNDSPVANNDIGVVYQGETITMYLLANDYDVDGDVLRITKINNIPVQVGGSHQFDYGRMQLNADQSITFTPNSSITSIPGFTYTVSDGQTSSTAEVSVQLVMNPTESIPTSGTAQNNLSLLIGAVSPNAGIFYSNERQFTTTNGSFMNSYGYQFKYEFIDLHLIPNSINDSLTNSEQLNNKINLLADSVYLTVANIENSVDVDAKIQKNSDSFLTPISVQIVQEDSINNLIEMVKTMDEKVIKASTSEVEKFTKHNYQPVKSTTTKSLASDIFKVAKAAIKHSKN